MQVLFPKHVWLHTECMPTSHWRTGASHISLRVITVAWWISSKRITDPLPTSLSHCCCYLFCSAVATTVAVVVTCFAMLLLLLFLLLLLVVAVTCYCCYLLLLSLLLFLATAVTRYTAATCYNTCSHNVDGEEYFPSTGNFWRHWYNS